MTETFPWPIQNVAEWMPFWKGAGFFLATFILEDAAAIGAGLLLAAGAISWPLAFFSCFLGIWLGDAGLYSLARLGGRNWFERSRLKKFSGKVARSEAWFNRRGALILIFSRCVPGARLPTYLAAGFLRVPLPKFLLITGLAAVVWTFFVLRLAQVIGSPLIHWFNAYQHGALIFLGLAAGSFVLIQSLRWTLGNFESRKIAAKIGRWRHWEFWPAWLFYPPVAIYCVWLAIRYRGASLPALANPGILFGGIIGESKMATLKDLMTGSPEFTARAAMVESGDTEKRLASLQRAHKEIGAVFPFILKPDVGQRGAGLRLIRDQTQAAAYLQSTGAPLVAQAYAPGPYEAGIFYYRFPHEAHGRIFSITDKIFPVITGDGLSTIAELIERDSRAAMIAGTYLKRFAGRRDEVLAAGEKLKLVEAGNHAQGCIFRDGMHLWTPELEARIDEISKKLDGFFIGRYDIRYAREDGLRAGKNFEIIELNGAASEATSIYDARNSLWSAYSTLFKQWNLVFAIGAENRKRGAAPVRTLAVWRKWREYSRAAAAYPNAD